MKIHKTHIESGTHEQIAEEIGDLRYDSLAEFIDLLVEKIRKDASADAWRGRKQLAGILYDLASNLEKAKKDTDKAWNICRKYMEAQ